MATKAKGSSKLPTLCDLWSKLDEDFKALINNRIDNNGDGSSLLRLLRLIPNRRVEISTYLLQEFMTLYEHRENDFYFQVCGQQCMNVTLEDVLLLTHLPIIGRPIVPIDNRDRDAFNRFFSENSSLLSLVTLRNICCDTNRNDDERIKAVLLMIVTCLIAPNGNGQNCKTSYVQFIEKLDEVNSYAWGAAMLAYLYQGMKGWKTDDKAIDGFTWLIMGFFFSHFRGLYSIFNNAVEENQAHDKPKLAYLIESLEKTGKIHPKKANSPLQLKLNLVHDLLRTEENIEADVRPITWHPYNLDTLPPHLHDQIQYRTVVAPLFCYNYVEHHRSHVVAKQFEVLNDVDLQDVGSDLETIKFKANSGDKSINFRAYYNKEVIQWEQFGSRLAENYHTAQQSISEPKAAQQSISEPEAAQQNHTPLHTANSQGHLSDADVHFSPPSSLDMSSPSPYHAQRSSEVGTSEAGETNARQLGDIDENAGENAGNAGQNVGNAGQNVENAGNAGQNVVIQVRRRRGMATPPLQLIDHVNAMAKRHKRQRKRKGSISEDG